MSLTTLHSVFLENVLDLHQNILFSKIKDLEVSEGKSVAPMCLFWYPSYHQLISPQCLRLHKYSSAVSAEHHSTQRHLGQDSLPISTNSGQEWLGAFMLSVDIRVMCKTLKTNKELLEVLQWTMLIYFSNTELEVSQMQKESWAWEIRYSLQSSKPRAGAVALYICYGET